MPPKETTTPSTEIATVPEATLEVYTPPAHFEVVDRGAATTVTFDNIGDAFVGIYEYTTLVEVTDKKTGEIEKIAQAMFTGADGNPYCIFPGASLERGLRRLTGGDWVRITYERDVPTGQPSPMKSYVVERGMV